MMSIFRDFQYLEGLYEVRTLIIIHGVSFFFFLTDLENEDHLNPRVGSENGLSVFATQRYWTTLKVNYALSFAINE